MKSGSLKYYAAIHTKGAGAATGQTYSKDRDQWCDITAVSSTNDSDGQSATNEEQRYRIKFWDAPQVFNTNKVIAVLEDGNTYTFELVEVVPYPTQQICYAVMRK